MPLTHRPTEKAAGNVIDALRQICLLDARLNDGEGSAALRADIIVAFNILHHRIDAFAASLCDDEQAPDIDDAEACMLARVRQNEAANEAPEQPDALTRAIMRRAGALC